MSLMHPLIHRGYTPSHSVCGGQRPVRTKVYRSLTPVARLLRLLVRVRRVHGGDTRLLRLTVYQYRNRFKQTCRLLGLDQRFVPHSLRHGGATHLYMRGWRMDDIQTRGRWEVQKTCRRYVQAAQALIASIQVPQHLADAGRVLAADSYQAVMTALSQRHTGVGRRG